MSASYGLVKFKKTGNVYYCCYEGTSDIMIPFLCTPEECFDKSFDGFCAITYCRELGDKAKTWEFPEVDDLDDIEIYSDYGGGFYWNGIGSESAKMIKEEINFGEKVYEYTDGKPLWINDFERELDKIYEKLINKRS